MFQVVVGVPQRHANVVLKHTLEMTHIPVEYTTFGFRAQACRQHQTRGIIDFSAEKTCSGLKGSPLRIIQKDIGLFGTRLPPASTFILEGYHFHNHLFQVPADSD